MCAAGWEVPGHTTTSNISCSCQTPMAGGSISKNEVSARTHTIQLQLFFLWGLTL
jgi:hypothetical protein